MSELSKLLILDKDGTLVSPRSGAKFVNEPWDQEPRPRVKEILSKHCDDGWVAAIASNQGGISAGHKTLENTILEMKFCLELFPEIETAFFCPDFDGRDCWRVWGECDEEHRILYGPATFQVVELGIEGKFRKPDPGMLLLAVREVFSTAELVTYVGDRPEDEGAAIAAGIPFRWAEEFFS